MLFTHEDDPSRTATYEQVDDEPRFVVRHTDASGKARRKSFKKGRVELAHDAALRFLLNKERYRLRAPQEGPVAWMTRIESPYYGGIGHTVDPETGCVWIIDAKDGVHRIEPGTCATRRVALRSGGSAPSGRIVPAGDDAVWVLPWNLTWVGDVLMKESRVFHVRFDGDAFTVDEVHAQTDLTGIVSLSSTRDGELLCAGPEGAQLLTLEGSRGTFATTPGPDGDTRPFAAISDDGRWVACSHVDHVLLHDRTTQETTRLNADHTKWHDLQVSNDGAVYVSGFRYPSWGTWLLTSGDPERVSHEIHTYVTHDGQRLVEVTRGKVVVRDATRPGEDEWELRACMKTLELPVLGMAKYGRAVEFRDQMIVLTDAYTVSAVRV